MRIDHVALWTTDLERCKQFYVSYFGAVARAGYVNPVKGFRSCFLSFGDGTRIAISLGSEQLVDELTQRLKHDGFPILEATDR